MNVQAWTFVIVGLTFALYIGIAIWSKARSTGEFYVAGKGVHPVANGMATAADWMSAASFIGMAGMISFMGYDGSVYLMGWTGGYVLLALLLAPYLRKFGKFTVPDFVGDRYYSQSARIVAVFCAVFVSFTYVAGQMRGVGLVFSRFLEVRIDLGVVIGMGIVFFYAVLGGMKGITYTQVAQYCVLIFAYMVPAIFVSIMMTGNPIPQIGFGGMETGSGTHLLDKLDGLHAELGFASYTDGSKAMIDVLCITAALMVGTAGLPHVIIRFYTVPRVRDARSSAGWALLFIAILYTTAPAVAVFARTNLLNTVSNQPYASMPEWFSQWEQTTLIGFTDKNNDGLIQYVGDPKANELTIDRDIMVLANPRDRRPARLGRRSRRGRWTGGCAVDGSRFAVGRIDRGQPRPAQARHASDHHRKGRAEGLHESPPPWRCASPATSASTLPTTSRRWSPSPSASPPPRFFPPSSWASFPNA